MLLWKMQLLHKSSLRENMTDCCCCMPELTLGGCIVGLVFTKSGSPHESRDE
jgi:hypothetical protein